MRSPEAAAKKQLRASWGVVGIKIDFFKSDAPERLSQMESGWNEPRLPEGYPASHVTMTRRKGTYWFVGGICAQRPRNARVILAFLHDAHGRLTCTWIT